MAVVLIPVWAPEGLDIQRCRVCPVERGSSLWDACVYLTTVENLWKRGEVWFHRHQHSNTHRPKSCSHFHANQTAHQIKARPCLSLPPGWKLCFWGDRRLFHRERWTAFALVRFHFNVVFLKWIRYSYMMAFSPCCRKYISANKLNEGG